MIIKNDMSFEPNTPIEYTPKSLMNFFLRLCCLTSAIRVISLGCKVTCFLPI